MINIMTINNYRAVITFDPDMEMFRGEFLGLNGGADFYASTVKGLHTEGAKSLRVFLDVCAENGIEPMKSFSGKFNARISPELHLRAAELAAAKGVSLNDVVAEAIEHEINACA
ncbi:type II toxin-antitoxin system HicB family antitoxin [Dyella subtropica]|uniref:type II toxin-antitoxin system HicB family antitoxin n=1 Tax=Dyella subtropica TaxID=2992127 RepID=UPI002255C7EE|nr:type II toxin-antitoxin system HicB family antitoxin [Dyella subtropica]